ncbi:hypothetical protein GCM10009430_22100 [Aquimarina litoralis]|uniref:Holin-X, holin superfamily III n=1 Tax=Aquimarina litoralis TaxID=584605 RepID=A0ABP3U2R8_9FLAO
MKEEKFKELIIKSTIETSDDFINKVMQGIQLQEEAKKQSLFWSFPVIIIVCTVLILMILGTLFYTFNTEYAIFSSIPRIPIFLVIIGIGLNYINQLIRFQFYK